MKGKIKKFNGIYGIAEGEDNQIYYLHKTSITDNKKKYKPNAEVDFEFEQKGSKKQITQCKRIQTQEQFVSNTDWLYVSNKDNLFRCMKCGSTSTYHYSYCPHCGRPMTMKAKNKELAYKVQLPCYIGDFIYFHENEKTIIQTMVTDVHISRHGVRFLDHQYRVFRLEDYCKTWFCHPQNT